MSITALSSRFQSRAGMSPTVPGTAPVEGPSHLLSPRPRTPEPPTPGYGPPEVTPAMLRWVVDQRSRELGLTRDRVAAAAGVSRSTLFEWLSGHGQPSPSRWSSLARALHLSVADMFSRCGTPLSNSVARARLEHGWTRGQLTRSACTSFATVAAAEAGVPIRPDAAARLAAVLGLDAAFISAAAAVTSPAASPLGRALEVVRLERGWTIAALARHLGVTRQLASAWLLGAEPVARRWHVPIADLLRCPLSDVETLAGHWGEAEGARSAGAALAAARRTRGLSQVQLAGLVAVSASTVRQWESNRRKPSPAAAELLHAALRAAGAPDGM
jgi:transcriptional regulator with XRE-family HTH domain